jgi:hypothetical protein
VVAVTRALRWTPIPNRSASWGRNVERTAGRLRPENMLPCTHISRTLMRPMWFDARIARSRPSSTALHRAMLPLPRRRSSAGACPSRSTAVRQPASRRDVHDRMARRRPEGRRRRLAAPEARRILSGAGALPRNGTSAPGRTSLVKSRRSRGSDAPNASLRGSC